MKNELIYWNGRGQFQDEHELLEVLIPISGCVEDKDKNPKLEIYRRAVNCYNDLYNFGLRNAKEFKEVFGLDSDKFRDGGVYKEEFYYIIESMMDVIILLAHREQCE